MCKSLLDPGCFHTTNKDQEQLRYGTILILRRTSAATPPNTQPTIHYELTSNTYNINEKQAGPTRLKYAFSIKFN
jgi:hypothetical protein